MPKRCQLPTCSDCVQNGTETDIDCGGPSCAPCADGGKWAKPSDCQSSVCNPSPPGTSDLCQAPTCTDGVKNGLETGIDCGGPDVDGGSSCPPCGP